MTYGPDKTDHCRHPAATTMRTKITLRDSGGRSERVGSLFQVGDHAALAFSSVQVADLKKTPDPLGRSPWRRSLP
jgi:hypothetical protein